MWFQQFSELDRINHSADVVGQSVPGGRTDIWERPHEMHQNRYHFQLGLCPGPLWGNLMLPQIL